MIKKFTFVTMALLLSTAATAQSRTIARGAVAGELYMTTECYGIDNSGQGYDTILYALLHLTEHGKKAEIVYSCNYLERDKMQPEVVLTDATEGVVYIHDQILRNGYIDDRLWVSFDYGKNWELRDEPVYQSAYVVANVEGLIYRAGGWGYGGGAYKSTDYGETFIKVENMSRLGKESGLKECDFFSLIGRGFYYTYDCFENYVNLTIDSLYVYGHHIGHFPDVFHGGKEGEVYVTSWFPDKTYKASFSADTGYHFREVYHSEPKPYEIELQFMSDRRAGDFYIINNDGRIWTYTPYGFYTCICIEHYTDYGETLVGTYCHELQRHYLSMDCLGIMDLQATVEDNNNILLGNRFHKY